MTFYEEIGLGVSLIPGVHVFDNAIDNCDEILAYIKTLDFSPAKVLLDGALSNRTGVDTKIRDSKTVYWPMYSLFNPDIVHHLNQRVWKFLDHYATYYNIRFTNIDDVAVNKYDLGEFYSAHIDEGNEGRIISLLLYLNDVEEGGETLFNRFDIGVKPKKGRIVVFPSNYVFMHSAEAPISNSKYSIAYWATR